MRIFKDLSIRYKLVLVILVVTTVTLLIGFSLIITFNIKTYEDLITNKLTVVVRNVGYNCIPALDFSDKLYAKKYLANMSTIPEVVNARLYDYQDNLFASYNRDGFEKIKRQKPERKQFMFYEDDYLHIYEPLTMQGSYRGTLYVRASKQEINEKIKEIVNTFFLILLGLLLFSILLAGWLQKLVSKPIIKLTRTVEDISYHNDFSLRVKKQANDEIGVLYDNFNYMLERIDYYINELERNNQELSEFNYVASHDLREPLRTLTSYCQLLKDDLGNQLSDDAKEDIHFITEAADRMNTLILDLLQLSRAGRVEFNYTEVNLNDVMKTIMHDLKTTIDENDASVLWEDLPIIKADKSHISRLMQNLISNAVKFKADHAPLIKIYAEEKTDKWIIAVTDNGIGIDPRYQEQIFVPFKRLHGIGKYSGTGIGLAICKKIIERHDGKIWVESERGKGSTFFFSISKNIDTTREK